MSATATVMDATMNGAGHNGVGDQEAASNGRLPDDWLHDPLDAMARPRGPYTLETADTHLDQKAVELYNGWLVWQEMTDIKERTIVATIQDMLSLSARKAGFGQALPDQAECLLPDGHVIKPDAALISWHRLQTATTPQGPNDRVLLLRCPELVVESRSPSNWRKQEAMKRTLYFANGAEIVWDVDEANEVIYVYDVTTPSTPVRYGTADQITCRLLPNWHRNVADIFAEQLSAEAVAGEVADAWREEGLTIGREQGITIGREAGKVEGWLAALELGLELKFGTDGLALMQTLHQVQDPVRLQTFYDGVKTAQTLDEFRSLVGQHLG